MCFPSDFTPLLSIFMGKSLRYFSPITGLNPVNERNSSLWLKKNVLSWSDSAKLPGLYLLTCPHCNLLGCFRLPIGYVASDLNWDEQQVAKALNELEQDQFLIRCEESGWTLIRSFLKHNPIENPNQGKAAFRMYKYAKKKKRKPKKNSYAWASMKTMSSPWKC